MKERNILQDLLSPRLSKKESVRISGSSAWLISVDRRFFDEGVLSLELSAARLELMWSKVK